MRYLPLFSDLKDRHCLVIGGNETAARKLRLLLGAGARPLVLADTTTPEIAQWQSEGALTIETRRFRLADLRGAALVVVADAHDDVAETVSQRARSRGIPVNVVDRPALCTAVFPGIIDRDPVLVAIGSAGTAPVLVRRLREKIETLLPARIGNLASLAGRFRGTVSRMFPNIQDRRAFWEWFLDGPIAATALKGDERAASDAMLRLINRGGAPGSPSGCVALVGAGPGDPDLLTLRALRALQDADVIVYDALVDHAILDMARRDAERIDVGKRKGHHRYDQDAINALLARRALSGYRVVRLKGGDPFIFGRGGEELAYLKARDIQVEVVPGVTAALGAAAIGEIPLTHRSHASSVILMTGHSSADGLPVDPELLANEANTVVVYMGVGHAAGIAATAIRAGRPSETPVAVIENATRAGQRVLRGHLGDLGGLVDREAVSGPALLMIGDVTRPQESEQFIPEPRRAIA